MKRKLFLLLFVGFILVSCGQNAFVDFNLPNWLENKVLITPDKKQEMAFENDKITQNIFLPRKIPGYWIEVKTNNDKLFVFQVKEKSEVVYTIKNIGKKNNKDAIALSVKINGIDSKFNNFIKFIEENGKKKPVYQEDKTLYLFSK